MDKDTIAKIVGELYLNNWLLSQQLKELEAQLSELQQLYRQSSDSDIHGKKL